MRPLRRGDTWKIAPRGVDACTGGVDGACTITVVSDDGRRRNILGENLRSVLVRCEHCRASWAFQDAAREARDA